MEIKVKKDPRNPSAADVIDAFGRAFDPQPVFIVFQMEDDEHPEGRMRITGLAYAAAAPGAFQLKGELVYGGKNRRAHGLYNANHREGNLSWLPS